MIPVIPDCKRWSVCTWALLALLVACSAPDTPPEESPVPTVAVPSETPSGVVTPTPRVSPTPDLPTPTQVPETPAPTSPTPGGGTETPQPTATPAGPTPTASPVVTPTEVPVVTPTATPTPPLTDADGDGSPAGVDCNDTSASIYPGAPEVCDSVDNDCDGEADEGAKITYYYDGDRDGFGTAGSTYTACTAPVGYVAQAGDCNDTNASIYPGAAESCDGVDNNCNGSIDEGFVTTFYYDGDKDGYGQTSLSIRACSAPVGYVSAGGDCNDQDASIHPGVNDTCDGKDNDCDAAIDENPDKTWYRDADSDGYGSASSTTKACTVPSGYVASSSDCNDSSASINPAATEVCDGVDNDCDQSTDEGFSTATTWFYDGDRDGYGVESTSVYTTCPSGATWARSRGDCQDSVPSVHPGASDTLGDLIDADCGGFDGPDPFVGLGTGSLSTLKAALGAAKTGQTLWIGPGTYREYDLTFAGKSVALRSTQLAAATLVDAQGLGRHFFLNSGESASTLIDGFTLQNGYGSYYMAGDGGSILISYSAGEIRNCVIVNSEVSSPSVGGGITVSNATDVVEISYTTIQGCYAKYGGGMAIKYSDAWIHDCVLTENMALNGGGGLDYYNSTGTTERVTLRSNTADFGGGIYGYMMQSTSVLRDLNFIDNAAATYGGGLDLTSSSNPVCRNLYFYDNSAVSGGAIATAFSANPTFYNVRAWYNTVGSKGGAIYSEDASPRYYHLVATSNTAAEGGGVYVAGSTASPLIQYAILAYNSDYNLMNSPLSPAALTLLQSDLFAPTGNNHNLLSLDTSVLTVDPRFQGMSEGVPSEHHLSKTSSLINRGGSAGGLDTDGTLLDFGVYGGPDGGSWDRDFDGKPDYFWPGTITDAPAGFSSASYDCAEEDPSRSGC